MSRNEEAPTGEWAMFNLISTIRELVTADTDPDELAVYRFTQWRDRAVNELPEHFYDTFLKFGGTDKELMLIVRSIHPDEEEEELGVPEQKDDGPEAMSIAELKRLMGE